MNTKTCPTCGGQSSSDARFCRSCGGELARSNRGGRDRSRSTGVLLPLLLMAAIGLASVAGWLWWNKGAEPSEPAPPPAEGSVTADAAPSADADAAPLPSNGLTRSDLSLPQGVRTMWVTRTTRLRDRPTSDGSTVLTNLGRGDRLTGEWVLGSDRETRWLRINWEGREAYAWGSNLAESQPPPIVQEVHGDFILLAGAIVREYPRDDAREVDRLSAPRAVEIVGVVPDGWVEIARSSGGVGYVRPAQFRASYADYHEYE